MAPAVKKSKPVTLKHLAATLAEEHQLTKKGGEALLTDLVGLITKHLKKGERIRIVGLGIL
jgi:DNA-binding protein HU-beta